MVKSGTRSRGVLGFALAAAVAAAAADARAAAPALKWRFTAGEALHYRMEQKTVTEVKANGQNIKTTVNQTIDTTWAVQSVDASGAAEMTQTVDRVKTRVESPFGAFEYDSKEGKAPEGPIAAGVVPMLKALVGAAFRYKISAQGELSDVRVPESLMKALKEAGPPAAGGSGMFSEEGLKNMIYESSLILPSNDLDKPWTRQSKIPSPPVGTLVLDKTYKYEGPDTDKGGQKISLGVVVKLDPDPKANLDIKVTGQEGKGAFYFDDKAGRVARSEVSERVEMLITVMNTQVTQSTDTSTSMKLVGTDPGAAK